MANLKIEQILFLGITEILTQLAAEILKKLEPNQCVFRSCFGDLHATWKLTSKDLCPPLENLLLNTHNRASFGESIDRLCLL